MRKLEITVALGFDETILSFVSRLATANGAFDVYDFCWHLGFHHQMLDAGDENAIAALIDLAGEHLQATKYRRVVRDDMFFVVNGERLARGTFMRHRLRYCPQCLADDIDFGHGPRNARPYVRLSWCVRFLRICPKHDILLRTGDIREVGGSLDVSHMITDEISKPGYGNTGQSCKTTSFEHYIDARLWGRGPADRWIDTLPLYVAGRLCECVGATILFGKRYESTQISDAQWVRACEAGYQIVGGGQEAFEVYLRWMHDDFWQKDAGALGRHLYGRLYDRLDHELGDPAYDPVRQVVYDVAMNDLPLGIGDELFGPITERRNHSILTASKEYGIDSRTLRERLRRSNVLTDEQASLPNSRIILRRETMERYAAAADSPMHWTEARIYLGASLKVWNLVSNGGFVPTSAVEQNGIGPFYLEADLAALLERIFSMVTVEVEGHSDLKTLSDAAELAECKLHDAIALLMNGDLTIIGRDPSGSGIDSLRFDPDELRRKTMVEDHGGLSMRVAMSQMGVRFGTLRKLINLGYIEDWVALNPKTRHPQRIVRPLSVEAFEAEYVSLFRLAKERNAHHLRVKADLETKGVIAAITNSDVGTTFFRRCDL